MPAYAGLLRKEGAVSMSGLWRSVGLNRKAPGNSTDDMAGVYMAGV